MSFLKGACVLMKHDNKFVSNLINQIICFQVLLCYKEISTSRGNCDLYVIGFDIPVCLLTQERSEIFFIWGREHSGQYGTI